MSVTCLRHWYAYPGEVGTSSPVCIRCGAPNPKYRPWDDPRRGARDYGHAVEVTYHDPGSDEWNAQRQIKIGGSEIAAVLNLPGAFDSRFSLWHKKRGHATEENPEMEWGNRLEQAVIDKFMESHPEYVSMGRGSWVRDDRQWMIASPDQLLSFVGHQPDAGLEAKTSPRGDGWGRAGTQEFPLYYYCQCIWNMYVFGLQRWHLAVLISGCDYREYVIEWDDDAEADIEMFIGAGEEFIASLINNERPDIDDHVASLQVIRELHPDINGEEVEIPDEVAGDYLLAAVELKRAEKSITGPKARLMDVMGNAKYATLAGTRFAFRMSQTRNGVQGLPFLRNMDKNINALLITTTEENDHGRTSAEVNGSGPDGTAEGAVVAADHAPTAGPDAADSASVAEGDGR